VPLPHLTAAIVLSTLLTVGSGASAETVMTAEVCAADRQQLLAEIAKNRDAGLKYYQDAIAEAANPEVRAELADQLQQIWDREEVERRAAYIIWRDCDAYVKSQKVKKTE